MDGDSRQGELCRFKAIVPLSERGSCRKGEEENELGMRRSGPETKGECPWVTNFRSGCGSVVSTRPDAGGTKGKPRFGIKELADVRLYDA